MLVHKSLHFQLLDVRLDPGGRYVLLHSLIEEIPVVIVEIYLPPPADVGVLHDLMQQATLYNVENVLFIGDFNMTPNRELDRMQMQMIGPQQQDLSRWASTFHMTDVWCHFTSIPPIEFTCLSTTHRTMSHIDLAYASPSLVRRLVSAEILSRGISDHAPVSVTIQLSPMVGERMWRLSKYWIMEPEIQEELPETLCGFWINNADSAGPLVQWDAFKAWLRGEYMTRNLREKDNLRSL